MAAPAACCTFPIYAVGARGSADPLPCNVIHSFSTRNSISLLVGETMPLAGLTEPSDPWLRQFGGLEVSQKISTPIHRSSCSMLVSQD